MPDSTGFDLSGLFGAMNGNVSPSGDLPAIDVPANSGSFGQAIKDNAGLLGTIAALSVLANNNGKRSAGQLLGHAGIDALNGLSAFGAARMQQQALQQQRAATQADRDLNREMQRQRLGLQQLQFLEDYGVGMGGLGGGMMPMPQMPQGGSGMPPMGAGRAPQGGAGMPPMGGGAPQGAPQGGGQGDPFAGVGSAAMPTVPSQYEAALKQAAVTYGVPEQILRAVLMQESGGDANAVSHKGARGPMQLMPDYHPAASLSDPTQNIMEGAKQLAEYNKMFGGDWTKTLQAYNWGSGNMQSYLRTGRGMGKDANGKLTEGLGTTMPVETQRYVPSVLQRLGLGGQQQGSGSGYIPRIGEQNADSGLIPAALRPYYARLATMPGKMGQRYLGLLQADSTARSAGLSQEVQRTQLAMQRAEMERKQQERDPGFQRQKTINESDAKYMNTLQEEYDQLRGTLGNMAVLEQLLNNGLKTGATQDLKDSAGRFLQAFGIDPAIIGANDLAKRETFNSLVHSRIFDILGAQKGPQTDQDAVRAGKVWASIQNTEEGNRWINELARNSTLRKMEERRFILERMNTGMSRFSATRAWEEYAKTLPSLLPSSTTTIEEKYGLNGSGQKGSAPAGASAQPAAGGQNGVLRFDNHGKQLN